MSGESEAAPRRRFEPWPWVLAAMLGAMIATSISFYAVAASHRDPEVERVDAPSGAVAPAPGAPRAERGHP
ncbi:MAG: hypothetical protein KC560_06880 [Myxococcales bacterium]|nr:hypothetical protein [Myxococcales bacterium]